MKLESARLYQAIPIKTKLETYLTVKSGHSGLKLEWNQGLLKIEADALEKPVYVPSSNVMFFSPLDDEPKAKGK